MGSELASAELPFILAALALGILGGWAIGRRAGAVKRAVALQLEVASMRKEAEQAAAALESARKELEGVRVELADYRVNVSDHFAGTSERFRELTLQYRALFEHLSEGARELCPDGMTALEGGLGLDALPEQSGDEEEVAAPPEAEAGSEQPRPEA